MIKPKVKVWLEYKGKVVLDEMGAYLLNFIKEEESLIKAAKRLKVSYKFAWNYLKKIEEKLEERVVRKIRGGAKGGKTVLTGLGRVLLKKYLRFNNFLGYAIKNEELWVAYGLRSVERNVLSGKVVDVRRGLDATVLKIEITTPVELVSIITSEAVDNLNLVKNEEIEAIIKATEVMVDKEEIIE